MKQRNLMILMFIAMLTWGETWVSAKVLANYLSAYELVFWRFFISTIGLIPIILYMYKNIKIDLKNLLLACMAGVLLILYNKYFFLGTKYGDSGFGGVLVTTLIPINTFIILTLFFKKKIKLSDTFALMIGAMGTMTILNIWNFDLQVLLATDIKYFLLAALIWPFITIISSFMKDIFPLIFSFYMFLFASLFDYIFVLDYQVVNIFNFDLMFWLNILLLSLCATTFGTSVYFIGVAKLGSRAASSYFFLVPLSAMIFSVIFLDEKISYSTVLGGMMGIVAVYIINGYSLLNVMRIRKKLSIVSE